MGLVIVSQQKSSCCHVTPVNVFQPPTVHFCCHPTISGSHYSYIRWYMVSNLLNRGPSFPTFSLNIINAGCFSLAPFAARATVKPFFDAFVVTILTVLLPTVWVGPTLSLVHVIHFHCRIGMLNHKFHNASPKLMENIMMICWDFLGVVGSKTQSKNFAIFPSL